MAKASKKKWTWRDYDEERYTDDLLKRFKRWDYKPNSGLAWLFKAVRRLEASKDPYEQFLGKMMRYYRRKHMAQQREQSKIEEAARLTQDLVRMVKEHQSKMR